MNRTKFFQFCIFVISLVSILFLTTCEKDPTGPSGNTPVTTATIGADGGKLETEDFLLQVPAGSFSNDVTLNLSISTEESGFGENSVSESFIIDGIPDEFDKSIRVAIKYNGELSDSSYMVHGKITNDIFNEDSSIVYQLISIKDSSEYLVGNIEGKSGEHNSKRNYNKSLNGSNIDILQILSGRIIVENDHFKINSPNYFYRGTIQQSSNTLEELYNQIVNELKIQYNINLSGNIVDLFERSGWDWPIWVVLVGNDNKPKFRYSGRGKPTIVISESIVVGGVDIETKISFEQILITIAINSHFSDAYDGDWFHTGILTWLEDYLGNQKPDKLVINELAPFNGMENRNGNDEFMYHGYGMSSFIKYLVNKNTVQILGEIIASEDYKGDVNYHRKAVPVKAILNNVNGLVADWWPDFLEQLVGGQIYNINSSVFLNTEGLGGTWNIDSDEGTETFLNSYQDLSAKRFLINLKNANFNENANLYLDASGNGGYDGVATIVFGVNSSNLQHLVTAKNGPASIPDLKQYYDNGTRQFIVVVVNSMHNGTDYLGSSDIELNVEVKVEENDYNYCSVSVRTNYDIYDDGTLWGENNFSADRTIYHGFNGNMVNGVFTGTAYPTDQFGNTYTGSVSVNLNGSINDFSMELTENKYIENHTLYWGKNVTEVGNYNIQGGGGIQHSSGSQYTVSGTTTCSHLTGNSFTRYLEIFNPYSGNLEWTVNESSTNSYSCNGGSRISITFSKQ